MTWQITTGDLRAASAYCVTRRRATLTEENRTVEISGMDLSRSFRQRLARMNSPTSTPYVGQYVLGVGSAAPDSVDMKAFPGLLFHYALHAHDGSTRIASCWSTKDHFVRDGQSFAAYLGNATVELHGFMTGPEFQPEAVWKRVPWYTIVLGVAAFMGAVQALGSYFDWIFRSPSLELKSENSPPGFIEGSEFRQTWQVVNLLPIAHRDLRLTAAFKDLPNARTTVTPLAVPHLAVGSSQDLALVGVAPPPGRYLLIVEVQAKAGMAARAKTFGLEQEITVWPKLPTGVLSVKAVQANMALLSGSLSVGREATNGLDCELEIQRVPALTFDGVFEFPNLHQNPWWATSESSGNEVALLRWTTVVRNNSITAIWIGRLRHAHAIEYS